MPAPLTSKKWPFLSRTILANLKRGFKPFFLIGFIFFISPDSFSQNAELDSLRQLLNHEVDTIRLDALIDYGSNYIKINPDSSIAILNRAIKETHKLNYAKREGKAYTRLGITYGKLGKNAEALEVFKESKKVNERIGNWDGIASSYTNMGIVFKNIGDYGKSLNYHFRAIQILDSINDIKSLAGSYNNLGVIYEKMEDYKQSRIYYEKEISLKQTLGDSCKRCLHNLGLLESAEGNYDTALDYMNQYLAFVQKEKDPFSEAKAFGNLAHIYKEKGNIELTNKYLKKSLAISRKYGLKREMSAPLFSSISIALEENKISLAEELTKEYLSLAEEQGNLGAALGAERFFATIYEKKGNFRQALIHQRKYDELKDILHQKERENSLQMWQIQLDVHEMDEELQARDQEVILLNKNRELEKKWRWALIALLLFAVIMAIVLYRSNQIRAKNNQVLREKNQVIEEQKTEIELINFELEKRMLRAQINPHFIFNSLSSIQHFILNNDRKSALTYLSKFSTLLRQALENSVNINVVLAEEIRLLKTYLELEALRFDDQFSFAIETDDSIDPDSIEVPILLVQPYVENAILHGLLPKNGNRNLNIYFSDQGDFTVCKIWDNGIGREASALRRTKKKLSLGMAITQKRVALLHNPADIESAIVITDLFDDNGLAEGTEVLVRIPKSLN